MASGDGDGDCDGSGNGDALCACVYFHIPTCSLNHTFRAPSRPKVRVLDADGNMFRSLKVLVLDAYVDIFRGLEVRILLRRCQYYY